MNFSRAESIADAVLYEGYLLYPYRKTSLKNQFRWQFGVVVPPSYSLTNEPSMHQAEWLMKPEGGCRLDLRLRFLRVVAREEDSWEEGQEHSFDFPGLIPAEFPLSLDFRQGDLTGKVHLSAFKADPFTRLRLRVENTCEGEFVTREEAVRHSMVGLHSLIGIENGTFLSTAGPPTEAVEAAAACRNLDTWPVLIGNDLVLSSPIILEDQPEIAPESPGSFFDSTEIDELLTLRVMTLTDEEKDQASSLDPRAREIIERVDQLEPGWQERLHGAVRKLESSSVTVGGCPIGKDSRVLLRPRRRADAQDMFLEGREARVVDIHRDLDGETLLAVTVEGDPGADLHDWYGRYYYFHPEEVETI